MMHQGLPILLAAAPTPDSDAVGEALQAAAVADSAVAPLLAWLVLAGIGVLLVGMLLCLFRVVRGPHLGDRVLAADTLALQVVGLVMLLSVSIESTVFFDMALVLAILGFVSTVAFSQYIYVKGGGAQST